jgi:hypothetical protein
MQYIDIQQYDHKSVVDALEKRKNNLFRAKNLKG